MAPTSLSPSPSPPPPSLWIPLQVTASRSHIVHRVMGAVQSRRLPLIYHQSYIRARALSACRPMIPCLIPACRCADDGLLGMLRALGVGFPAFFLSTRRPLFRDWVHAPPPPSSAAVHLPWKNRKSPYSSYASGSSGTRSHL
ncbi:hypothetical protein B0H13DRAFT_2356748 [Mycena leptocephala]|nr:hypothetical protein B0H13DRAFT_2356748 [Mycena leptocephala]